MKETNVLRKHLKDDEILDLVILFQTRRMEAAKTLTEEDAIQALINDEKHYEDYVILKQVFLRS